MNECWGGIEKQNERNLRKKKRTCENYFSKVNNFVLFLRKRSKREFAYTQVNKLHNLVILQYCASGH